MVGGERRMGDEGETHPQLFFWVDGGDSNITHFWGDGIYLFLIIFLGGGFFGSGFFFGGGGRSRSMLSYS